MNNIENSILFSILLISLGQIIGFILSIVANYLLFKKIGENKWLAICPIVNDYIIFRTFWSVKAFYGYIVLLVTLNIENICNLIDVDVTLPPILALIICFAGLFFEFLQMKKISEGFEKGTLCAFLLLFFYPFTMLYLVIKCEPTDDVKARVIANKKKKEEKKDMGENNN